MILGVAALASFLLIFAFITIFMEIGILLLSVALAIITAANFLPGFKAAVNKGIPQLDNMQCHQLPELIEKANSLKSVHLMVAEALQKKGQPVEILDLDSAGKLNSLFNRNSAYQARSVDQIKIAMDRGGSFPILLLDVNKMNQVERVDSPGPILIYNSSDQSQPLKIRVSSSSAIVFCNENIQSSAIQLDTPVVVASDTKDLNNEKLVNTKTPDKTVKLIPFADIHGATKKALVRALNGDPLIASGGQNSNQLRAELTKDIHVVTIEPKNQFPPVIAAPRAPVVVTEIAPNVTQVETQPEEPIAPEEMAVIANPELAQMDQLPADTKMSDLAWSRTNCKGGFIYVKCEVNLERKDLQFIINNAFAKKGGKIVGQKKYGPVSFEFAISNPRVFFANNQLGIQVDVVVNNISRIKEKKDNTIGSVLKENADPTQQRSMREKLGDLAKLGKSAINAAQNMERSLALALPEQINIKNAVATVAQIEYDSKQGLFFLSEPKARDFELSIGEKSHPTLGGFKPFVLSSMNEFLKPFFREHPVYDLHKVTYMKIPLAYFFFQDAAIQPNSVKAHVKLGWGPFF